MNRPASNSFSSSRSSEWPLLAAVAALGLVGVVIGLAAFPRHVAMDFSVIQLGKGKTVTTLLRQYAADHGGTYPEKLDELKDVYPDAKKYLSIDLRNGSPPLTWAYHQGLSEASPDREWLLYSPPLARAGINPLRRWWHRFKGGPQPPPESPMRVVFFNDTTGEVVSEIKFQAMARHLGIELSE